MDLLIETALLHLNQTRTIALWIPHRWNWLVMTRTSLGMVLQWARESCCYCEQCPWSLIHLCWVFCQRMPCLNNILKKRNVALWATHMVIGFLLPSLKYKLPIWAMFKLPFRHPVIEILLPTGVFLLPKAMRLMKLFSLGRFIVTGGYVNPKTHPVCRCSDVIP